ncbi:helix-turn-helix domain-containing protein [Nitratireductor kimnyeongensis]|uniref:Helix-turn-helix domain-containing protein n=1 Tax=Nitratireductor kimnyeongensis TaxID=430679 RepID=A0ABW0TE03_9HYPH|nr:helix-turn-helix domain-containing protein [Nitratireductor kimnyeongensis]QZZ37126.1 helix-turn-helix domain-containing protein [Nitratireductor kimnyeongensis]
MTTQFGKELRKLRIEYNEKLFDMAGRIGKSVAFLSAVERGKKALPQGFEEAVIESYSLRAELAGRIRAAADQSRRTFTLQPSSALARDTAGMMARRMNNLSEDQLKQMLRILKSEGGETHEGDA